MKRRRFTPHATVKDEPAVHLWDRGNALNGQTEAEVEFIRSIKGPLRNAVQVKTYGSYKHPKLLVHQVVMIFREKTDGSRWLMDSPMLSLVAWLVDHSRGQWSISMIHRPPAPRFEPTNPPQVTVSLANHTDFVALMLLGSEVFAYMETRP